MRDLCDFRETDTAFLIKYVPRPRRNGVEGVPAAPQKPLPLRRCSCAGFKHTKQSRAKEGPVTCEKQPQAELPSFL